VNAAVAGVVPVVLMAADRPLAVGELTAGEREAHRSLPGGPRRRAWLTGRRALRAALTGCGLPADTSLYRFPSPLASLSHSGDRAVAAVVPARPARVAGVGVDIELDRECDPRTAPFFLTEAERARLTAAPAPARAAALLRLWTVKEALFKADPDNAAAVLRDYAVADPAARRGQAVRAAAPAVEFRYLSLAVPRGFLSVAVALSRPRRAVPVKFTDFDQMARQISALISVPVERLTPDTTIAELVPDSFTFVEVAVDLQEEYDVVLSQGDLKDLRTLGDLAELLRRRQAGSEQPDAASGVAGGA
jgi:4'-phosphopantetheinyl transferase EntD/acyl carrier protein